ncbi:MAG: DUF4136 domain-containing protein [Bacteroidota bacterium]
MKPILTLLAAFVLFSCGPAVYVDFDEKEDFSEYTTYQFYPDIESGLNQLDDKRIMAAIDSVLQQRGFRNTPKSRFFINFYANESVSSSRSTLGIGVGSGGVNGGVGVSGGIPIGGSVINQVLTIDFVNARGDQGLVWQAVVEKELKARATPLQKEAHFNKMVSKALAKFPPK